MIAVLAVGWRAPASAVVCGGQMGLVGNVVVGIVGGDVMRWAVAVGGAMILIYLPKVLGVFR